MLMNIPNGLFRDRENYTLYATNSSYFFSYDKSELSYYTNEPLFLYIAELFIKVPMLFPTLMGAFIGFIYSFYLVKNSRNIIIIIPGIILLVFNTFLIYPQVMQLRQGLATSLFIVIFFSVSKIRLKIILSLLLPFIHVVFIFIAPFYVFYQIYLRKKTTLYIIIFTSVLTFIFSFSFVIITGFLGLRQTSQSQDVEVSLGGGAFLLHSVLFLYIYFYGSKNNKDMYNWALIGMIIFVCSYFLVPSAGRLFVSFYPFVLYILVAKGNLKDLLILIVLDIIFIVLFFKSGLEGMLTVDVQSFYVEIYRLFYLM